MQTATLRYPYGTNENFQWNRKSKFQRRHILPTIINLPKNTKQQQRSFLPDLNTHTNAPLPPIKTNNKRPSSIRIQGNQLQTLKLNDASISMFRQPSRSRSRHSDKSDISGARSRPITSTGAQRSRTKSVRLKFGHPIKIRSSDFYASDLSESELRSREESFVNDSIRTATQRIRSSKIPSYEPLDDPNLQHFFQSSLVLKVVRKTLNIDLDERPSDVKNRSRLIDRDTPYHQIVAKPSSGYGKLNGYDCLGSAVSIHHHRSIKQDRNQSSANSSLKSFPTYSTIQSQKKKKFHPNNRPKQVPPVRHSTAATNDTAAVSNESQE